MRRNIKITLIAASVCLCSLTGHAQKIYVPGTGGGYIGLNVKTAGAKGDGKMYFDGALSLGSSTLTTKQPIVSATESGNTVTLTLGTDYSPLSPVPGIEGNALPPYFYNWAPGGTINVSGVNVAGYNGTWTILDFPSNSTLRYTITATGLGSGSGGKAWTSAPFTSADVGKLICVQTARGSTGLDGCGTITSYVDPTDVGLSFGNTTGLNISGLEFVYASDDTAAIQAAINSLLPRGGIVYFPQSIYGLSAHIQIPLNGDWIIVGDGAGGTITDYGGVPGYGIPVSGLDWLTLSMGSTDAGILIGNATVNTGGGSYSFGNQTVSFRDIALMGAVGYKGDGGGGYGIFGQSENAFSFYNSTITNFATACLAWSTNWESFTIDNAWITYCGGYGIDGSSTQNMVVRSSSFFQNGKVSSQAAIAMGKDSVIEGNTFGNNGTTSSGQVALNSGALVGNYVEAIPFFVTAASPTGAVNVQLLGNDDKTFSQAVFSAAGTALPTANNANILTRVPVMVSDATACTNGGSYTSGGSTHCLVTTNGTTWTEIGAGW